MKTRGYKTLAEFRAAKFALREERDRHAARLQQRLDELSDADIRKVMMNDAIGDLLYKWKPYRVVHDALSGTINGSTVSALGTAFASMQRSWPRRLIFTGLSSLAGMIFGEKDGNNETNGLHDLARSIGNIRNKLRRKNKAVTYDEIEQDM